jgi:hypothetical protein
MQTQEAGNKHGCHSSSVSINTKHIYILFCILKTKISSYLIYKRLALLTSNKCYHKNRQKEQSLKMFIFVRVADNFLLSILVYYNKHFPP